MSFVLILSLVFGGCCSNVISFEHMVQGSNINLGNIVTFTQFVSVTLIQLPNALDFSHFPFRLRPRHIPLKIHMLAMFLFFTSSVANNSVFKFDISVPIHIIIRCSGTTLTMIIGWAVCNKRYSKLQVQSAIIMTLGAIVASLYRDKEFSMDSLKLNTDSVGMTQKSMFGIFVVLVATALMSLLSLLNEWTYNKYGKHWKETLFYSHFLALPLFMLGYTRLRDEFRDLLISSDSMDIPIVKLPIATKLFMLIANNVTQFICIKGVNMLASNTDALTLSVVLLVRKFVSLLLSVYIYKNVLSVTAYLGTITVFLGAGLYSYGSVKTALPR